MKRVTVRHLLNHSSGLVNPIPVTRIHRPEERGPDPRAFLKSLLQKHARLRSEPGSTASYSNLNYLLLGELIVSISGEPFPDYVHRNILEPLGMTSTGFSLTPEMNTHAATSYQKRRTWMMLALRFMLPRWVFGDRAGSFRAFNRFYLNGAAFGGLIGSAEDAARFLRAHVGDGAVDGQRILTPRSVAIMQTVSAVGPSLEVGLGWFRRRGQSDYWQHLGGGGGCFNVMRIYPQDTMGVVMMGNSTSYDHERILAGIAGPTVGAAHAIL